MLSKWWHGMCCTWCGTTSIQMHRLWPAVADCITATTPSAIRCTTTHCTFLYNVFTCTVDTKNLSFRVFVTFLIANLKHVRTKWKPNLPVSNINRSSNHPNCAACCWARTAATSSSDSTSSSSSSSSFSTTNHSISDILLHCVQKKNTRSHFLSYLHEWCVDLNKNCSEYTKGKVDSNNVEIIYSLRLMTSFWHHICLAKFGASLQHAISREPGISFFCEYRVLAGAQTRSYRVLCGGI